jgi:hypothetical protein
VSFDWFCCVLLIAFFSCFNGFEAKNIINNPPSTISQGPKRKLRKGYVGGWWGGPSSGIATSRVLSCGYRRYLDIRNPHEILIGYVSGLDVFCSAVLAVFSEIRVLIGIPIRIHLIRECSDVLTGVKYRSSWR